MCNKLITVMKKTFYYIAAALGIMLGVFAFNGCTDYEADINSLNERLDALETGKIADVESQLASLQSTLASVQSAVDALEALGLENLQGQIDGLQGQIDNLNGLGLEDMKNQLEDLQNSIDDLQQTVDGIDLSKYATLDYVNGTFATKEAVEDINTALGALEARVEALEGLVARVNAIEGLYDVDTVKISEILDKIQKAQDDASSALGEIKSLKEALGVYATVAGALQDSLDSKLSIEDFNAKFNEALEEALANDGEITSQISSAIQEAVDAINALFASRLTSISLIPTAYLDGVPAIKFNSYEYYPKTIRATDEVVTASKDVVNIAAAAVDVNYHISPSNITKNDILTPRYIIQEAEVITRSASDIDLNVIDYAIEDDVLTATVRRAAGISLNHENGDYIYTASLKVPIAKQHLVEGETEANVYSEYSALYEDVVTPYIAAVIDESQKQNYYDCPENVNHFYGKYADAADENSAIAATCAYNEPLDLLAMVTGCEGNPDNSSAVHKEITKATLRANGLAFRFAVPSAKFELGENKTNQQDFAYVEGNSLMSTYINAPAGAEPNQASIDKTPVVRVELQDTVNSKIVDVRYFKIKWTPVPFVPEDEDLGLVYTFTDVLGCEEFDADITWDIFVEKVLSKVNGGKGLSYNEFIKIYKSNNAEVRVDYPIALGHDNTMTVTWDDLNAYDEHAAAFHWNILPSEYGSLIDGRNAEDIKAGDLLKTFVATIILPSNDDYNGTIKFKVAVDVLAPQMPSLVGLVTSDWVIDGELARIRPVQYGSASAVDYVTYNYDLTALFRTNNQGVAMNNAMPVAGNADFSCRAWSFQFAADQMTSYIPGFNWPSRSRYLYADEDMENGLGYELYNPYGTRATYMTYNDNAGTEDNAVENWHQDAHEDIALSLTGTQWSEVGAGHYRGTDAAIALLESIDTPADQFKNRVSINVWGRINPWNHVIVKTFDVVYIKPLYVVEKENNNQYFEDGVEGGRYINVEDLFDAHDSWNYPVNIYNVPGATGEVADANARRTYYDVQNPEFDLANARIGMELKNNNYEPIDGIVGESEISRLPLLSATDANASVSKEDRDGDGVEELTFTSERGWNLEKVVYIYIEVSIDHKWGTESMWVVIPVYPHGEAPQAM